MWEAYRIGLSLGLGIGIGGLLSALTAPRRWAAVAVAAGRGCARRGGRLRDRRLARVAWPAGSAERSAPGSWRRSSPAPSAAAARAAGRPPLVGLASLVLAALALVPVVGYLEAVALPAVAARARRRRPERYAGLRSLARD